MPHEQNVVQAITVRTNYLFPYANPTPLGGIGVACPQCATHFKAKVYGFKKKTRVSIFFLHKQTKTPEGTLKGHQKAHQKGDTA